MKASLAKAPTPALKVGGVPGDGGCFFVPGAVIPEERARRRGGIARQALILQVTT